MRQLLGTIIGVVGNGMRSMANGSAEYGIYAAALATSIVILNTAELGITNYLTRCWDIPTDQRH